MRRCAVCGAFEGSYNLYAIGPAPALIESHHIQPRGMGGRGKKAPKDAELRIDLCCGIGAGNLDKSSCHGAVHRRDLEIEHTKAGTRFRNLSRHLAARGVPADGDWHYALGEAYLP